MSDWDDGYDEDEYDGECEVCGDPGGELHEDENGDMVIRCGWCIE